VKDIDPIIEISSLAKRYGDKEVLRGVSMSFQGGIWGIIGPNGAGKSTLIKILLGLIKPSGGHAKVFGKDPFARREEILRDVGVLHECNVFPPQMSAMDYLGYAARLKGKTGEDVRAAVECAGTSGYVGKRISSLSAGMLQRVGFTNAILGFPRLVILDEPTSNLDPLARRQILRIIGDIHREHGTNFLISTHILPELERVCTDVMILNDGEQLLCSSYDDIRERFGTGVLEDVFIKVMGVSDQ